MANGGTELKIHDLECQAECFATSLWWFLYGMKAGCNMQPATGMILNSWLQRRLWIPDAGILQHTDMQQRKWGKSTMMVWGGWGGGWNNWNFTPAPRLGPWNAGGIYWIQNTCMTWKNNEMWHWHTYLLDWYWGANVLRVPDTSVWRHRKWYINELSELSLSLITSTKNQHCPEVWTFLNFTVHNYVFLDVYCLSSWWFPLDPDPGPCNPKGCL